MVIRCNNPQSEAWKELLFDPSYLPVLNLDSLPSFWGTDSVHPSSSGAIFPAQAGYEDELVYISNNQRWLSVIVFRDKSSALSAMEFRIENVAAVFKAGDAASGKTWWYSDSSGSGVILSLSSYNTIVEAVRPGNTFLFENDTLWIPVNEIVHRMGKLVK
jgi:hypothetical protein